MTTLAAPSFPASAWLDDLTPDSGLALRRWTPDEFRRRGLASAILKRIHRDAVRQGATRSILCSTSMGFPLYLSEGYSMLAEMQAFGPNPKL